MGSPFLKNFDLTGRVAVITGGNGGIGFGMCQALAGAGAKVVICGRDAAKNRSALKSLADNGYDCKSFEADVTKEDQMRALFKFTESSYGRLDILVNNAGINIRKSPQEFTVEEWETVISTNLTGPFLAVKAAYEHFLRAGGGKVINIGSMFSILGSPRQAAYGSSKGALVQLTRVLATAWAKDNIQVNAVLPGWIDTEFTRKSRNEMPSMEQQVLNRTPMNRWGKPEDLGGIAVFLSSKASDFITGTSIPVDGGFSIKA